ncbi:hypothetical protein [Streptomyces sp. TRM49041]|uniref:hypothetical protein n=1 Tax=Streptomyces sp. TRM49041 TaxID=2603216 RepID=UPI0011EBA2D2|nr:hypothetical protein [Streptomyces sp. TRM49041]
MKQDKYPLPRAVVLDETAVLALGAGNRMASRLVVEAENDATLRICVPAVCLTAAEGERAGVAEHVGSLPSVDIEALNFVGAAAVGKRLRMYGDEWSGAHAVHLAQPSVEWPRGRPVLSGDPERYRGTGVRVIALEK